MAKCKRLICDVCNYHIESHESGGFSTIKFKVKKYWSSWWEDGWQKETIHICPDCQAKIRKIVIGGEE